MKNKPIRFRVERTSAFDDSEKPCDGAVRSSFPYWTNRVCPEDGHVYRQVEDRDGWAIYINSLEELLKFHDRYGKIIIRKDWYDDGGLLIEIYDDWRE